MKARVAQQGLTLLEVMLALAVALSMLLFSIKQAQSYKLSSDIAAMKSNVDEIFTAASLYYRANCGTTLTSNTPVTISTLKSQGFLTTPLQLSSVVNTSDSTGGYSVQFNLVNSGSNPANIACSAKDCNSVDTTKGPVVVPLKLQINFFQMQVSVLLKSYSSSAMAAIKGAVAPTCMADSATTICSASSATGNWMVITRLPGYASQATSSTLWSSMPMLRQFNLQYTHDQMYELSNGTNYTAYPTTQLPIPGAYTCGE